MSHVSVMMSLQTLLSPERSKGKLGRFGIRMGETGYVATLQQGRLNVERREPAGCDVTFAGSPTDMVAAIHGGAPLEMLRIEGDMELAKRFVTLFPLPPKVA
jgi:hypothetical protein